MKKYSA